jgi:hypothetical protein
MGRVVPAIVHHSRKMYDFYVQNIIFKLFVVCD